ncbi:MAG: hypothetical protein ACYTA3_07705 [Planctomycetota bacterium]|jgi:hypothetical protein
MFAHDTTPPIRQKAQLPLAGLRLVELLLARGVGLRHRRLRRRVVVVGGHERSW